MVNLLRNNMVNLTVFSSLWCKWYYWEILNYTYDRSKVIISCRGAASGVIHKTRPFSFVSSNSIVLDEIDENLINLDFIKYFMNSVDKSSVITGTAQPQITIQLLKYLKITLPPLPEQERIVAKLDVLFAQHEAMKKALSKIPQLLKDFRQQVLTQAVTGKLTEEWRKGKDLQKFNRFKSIKLNTNSLGQKPSNWENIKLGNVSYVSNGSTPSRKIAKYWNGHIPWISSGQIQNNKITETKETITNDGLNNSSTKILPIGTVLIAMIGEGKTRAQSSILNINATINQNIASIEIGHDQIVPEYLQYFLIKNYEYHRTIGNGTGPKALNCQKVKEFDFLLPPLSEQQEIVSRVESLFAKADAIEARYKILKDKIDALPQALLHKAFKGELVPQLPTDGDAKDLLAEIIKLKEETQGKKGKNK